VTIVVRLGSTGSGPAMARRRLKAHGYDTHQTGAWNSVDMKKTMAFQHAHGLVADGEVGPLTWGQLLRSPKPKPPPKPPVIVHPPIPPVKPPVKPTPPPKPALWIPQHGIDCAWAHPNYMQVAAAGIKFVARYVSNDPSKDLTAQEAKDIAAHGMKRVLIGESTAGRAKEGHDAGVHDATKWLAQATAVGLPAKAPIFFAVDYELLNNSEIGPYFDGVVSVMGLKRSGAYGGLNAIKYLFDSKRITFGFQTYGWSYGHWDPRAGLRQTQNGVPLAGATGNWADFDLAVQENYGGW
jgi:hypothetical protein